MKTLSQSTDFHQSAIKYLWRLILCLSVSYHQHSLHRRAQDGAHLTKIESSLGDRSDETREWHRNFFRAFVSAVRIPHICQKCSELYAYVLRRKMSEDNESFTGFTFLLAAQLASQQELCSSVCGIDVYYVSFDLCDPQH